MNLHDHDIRYEALQEGEQIGALKTAYRNWQAVFFLL